MPPPLTPDIFSGGSLCVVGNVNRDIRAEGVQPGAGLFEDGETPLNSLRETIGGGGANSACAAAALGARVSFLGKIGADALGDRLERTLRQRGIAPQLARDPALPSGSSIALSFQNGRRHFLSYLPASRGLCLADLDLGALAGHDHLLRADVWFSERMLFEGNRQLFQYARRRGLAVSVDINWDPRWGRARADEIRARKDALRSALPWVTLAHGNARELSAFAETDDLSSALQRITQWGADAVVVHLGAAGAGYYHRGEWIVEPARPIQQPVHAAGCGDVLSACITLLHARSGMPARDQLRLANRIVAEYLEGKRALIPDLADLPPAGTRSIEN